MEELVGSVAAQAPLLGLLGWVLKSGMATLTRTLERNTKAVESLVHTLAVHHALEEGNQKLEAQRTTRMEEQISDLLQLHTGPHSLCRFTEGGAIRVEEGVKKIAEAM